jgi:diaminohydroxyphosphoribosylaminopyrimidine deaminase/5-amino-6-(5-phosphoribosylamino)uracil reductase
VKFQVIKSAFLSFLTPSISNQQEGSAGRTYGADRRKLTTPLISPLPMAVSGFPDSPADAIDRAWMQRCLHLARQAEGRTSPNPLVGAIVVNEAQQVVGKGFHPGAGQPHAEVFALEAAGAAAEGATLYVNLEPCNHYGRTPPCTEAILRSGVQRVVLGMVDPDPRVSGGGIDRLRQAGLRVDVGIAEEDCQTLNEAFVHGIRHHRPWGIWKYAMTLDGKIATATGHSAWVTGTEARSAVHRLRSICDAVIIGGNTVRQDNPRLHSHGVVERDGLGREPLRVVMSRSLELPMTAQLWNVEIAPTIVFTAAPSAEAEPDRVATLQGQGVEVVPLSVLSPQAVLADLYQRGCLSVLWECGGTLAATAVQAGCIQKVWAFIAPKLIGGNTAPSPLGDLGIDRMDQALPLHRTTWQSFGSDWCLQGYLEPPCSEGFSPRKGSSGS